MPKPSGFLKSLGPGLVTGAADDDPSGIATYSQVARNRLRMAWTMTVQLPLMAVIQSVAARIGCVSGHGIATTFAAIIRRGCCARWCSC